VFLNATASTLSAWATRVRQFGALGRSGVVAALASLATSLTATRFAGTAEIGLLLGMLLGVAAGWATLLVTIARRGLFPPVRLPRVSECRAYLHKYRQFPLFALPMTVSDQFTSSLPVLLFSTLFSPATAAYFALANSSLRQPLSLVSQSTGQVFYERAARSQNEPAELLRLTRATVGALASLAVVPLLFVALIGPRMFALVFGAEWAPAGEYARLLMIAVAFTFVASPVSTLPSVLRKQHVHLGLAVLTAVARVAALWVGARTGKPTVAVALYSFAEALTISIFLGWLFTRLRRTGAPAPKPLSGASAPHVAQ
jgi:O-antigen/teichoic acid export membrane protein